MTGRKAALLHMLMAEWKAGGKFYFEFFLNQSIVSAIASSIFVGIVAALSLILISPSMFERYGLDPLSAPMPLNNPGIISIPLSFLTLIVVSLMTQKKEEAAA